MRENFPTVQQWVLVHEGGFVNHPEDPGGATNFGVTQATYDAWRDRQGLRRRSVQQIGEAEVEAIYRLQYWDVVRGDDLPSGLDYAVYDFAVNSGPRRAVQFLQRIVGVKEDGWIGEMTLAAIKAFGDPVDLIERLCADRMAFLRRLRHWPTFGRGWTRRVVGYHAGAQAGDSGVLDRSTLLAHGAQGIKPPKSVHDGAHRKATVEGLSLAASVKDAATDKEAVGIWTTITGGATALAALEGPIAWAAAGVIVLAAVVGVVWLVRREAMA